MECPKPLSTFQNYHCRVLSCKICDAATFSRIRWMNSQISGNLANLKCLATWQILNIWMERRFLLNLNRFFVSRQRTLSWRQFFPILFLHQLFFRYQETITRGSIDRGGPGYHRVGVKHDFSADITEIEVASETGEPISGAASNRNATSRTFVSGADEIRGRGFVTSVRPDSKSSTAMLTSQLCILE